MYIHVRAWFVKLVTPPSEPEFFSNEYEALQILTFDAYSWPKKKKSHGLELLARLADYVLDNYNDYYIALYVDG